MKKSDGNFATLVIAMIIVIPLLIYGNNNHKIQINKQVHAINGEVMSINSLGLFEHDPLPWGGKGSTKYKFLYKQDGQIKIGYVLFFFSQTWIMDNKEVK